MKTVLLKTPNRFAPSIFRFLAFAACLLAGFPGAGQTNPPPSAAILQELRGFREFGSVLFIAAHPDDENTQLIAYLARGRNYRTAYLSVTRGDGGQNVLGPEFGDKLGVARTQELLAARRIDGGRQFFTRAIDFGYSKDYRETLSIWDKQQVIGDMVRVIRAFRPDVMIARFSPQPGATHGHHTASAVLAVEAFKVAGDPKAFPEQLDKLAVWQPKRLLLNGGGANAVSMNIGGVDPVSGLSFGDLAGRSRSMHKTQGFGNFGGGGRGGAGARPESFQLLDGEPATNDIMDGVDVTWGRLPGGAEIGTLADDIISKFDLQNPAASVPSLLTLRSKLAALKTADPVALEKRAQLDRALQSCLGLSVKTTIPQAEVVPGETLKMRHTASVTSAIPVRWIAVRYPVSGEVKDAVELQPGQPASREVSQILPVGTPLTQPYWLRQEGTPGMFRVDDPSLIGQPENPPAFPIEHVFEVGGQTLAIPDEPVQITHTEQGEGSRRLDVIPPVSIGFDAETAIFKLGETHPVEIRITAYRAGASGTLRLEAPGDWKVEPAGQSFNLAAIGDHAQIRFTVTAPAQASSGKLVAGAEIGGVRYSNQREEIRYPHIPLQLLQPPAALKAVSLDLATGGHKIGYLPGAGDTVDECLRQMGYTVTTLTDDDLTTDKLRDYDAVVIGVRAFNVRSDLASRLPGLFAYVEAGGTVVAQYNRQGPAKVAPYDLRLSGDRVTDETAPVTFLAPDHPVLNKPNKITAADFAGWVQERGIYYPNQWDEHFTPILAAGDPGETPLKGGLLAAQYGRGHYIYTGLVFFRQLPAGVPGAYRLFANLVSLGATDTAAHTDK